jgi:cobalt-zinc-cadmium efflux system protein
MADDTHSHGSSMTDRRALTVALLITAAFVAIEVIGAVITDSLALLSDAGHMLSDASALGLSLLAVWLASRPHTHRRTFGYHRVEILAALVNGITLIAISIYVMWEAAQRFSDPPEVESATMLLIATAGLGANIFSGFILSRSDRTSLNVRSAFWHVAGDALGSLGAIAAGIIMITTQWYAADPLVSVMIALLIVISGIRVTREALGIVLEFAPRGVDLEEVRAEIESVSGVTDVHDLHVWTITSDFVALSAHVRLASGADSGVVVREVTELVAERFQIGHVTVQPEVEPLHGGLRPGACCLGEHALPSA